MALSLDHRRIFSLKPIENVLGVHGGGRGSLRLSVIMARAWAVKASDSIRLTVAHSVITRLTASPSDPNSPADTAASTSA
jgi:hypothetical protein